ncbi:IS110 family transposase [Zunongwangia sp. F363]|uniref:IS110 family transposase n=1 Tax=Autumnicola tepida TaxID=3075595 RepID=A0ABU3CCZ8_9FLAO|nr:IS110 family transposase [Zunongwangia sp. F363]MDT0644212.1 IS110 family transposase [Zunongwangia sp. F363]
MKIKETTGIDVSKLTLDVCIQSNKQLATFENSYEGFEKLIKWVYKSSPHPRECVFFAFEHTGLYSEQLSIYLSRKGISYAIVPGLEIKRSLGIARGKDDKIDASRIALYAHRLRDEIKPCTAPLKEISFLKKMLSLRDRLVRQRSGYKVSLREQERLLDQADYQLLFRVQRKLIKELSEQIKEVETEMKTIVQNNMKLRHIFTLLISIKGIGKQSALCLIVYTEAFTKFNNSRQFAAYCGIAPFPNRSGTSLLRKTQVSHLANKRMKTLLDMCANSSIQHNKEISEYYQRRVSEGKNKTSTINIIRNKLISRAFAVIQRDSPYVNLWRHAS